MTSVGQELPRRRCVERHLLDERAGRLRPDAVSGSPERNRGGDLLRPCHLSLVSGDALRVADARREQRRLRDELRALVDPRPEPLDERRLPDEDVHEVDAAAALLVSALDSHERIDRVGAVGEEDVGVRRDQPEREGDDDEEPEPAAAPARAVRGRGASEQARGAGRRRPGCACR